MTFSLLVLAAVAAGADTTDDQARDTIVVNGNRDETSEGTDSYTVSSMRTATRLPLSIRETPQSVTVITRQHLDDLQMTNITDVARLTPGLFLNVSNGPGRPAFNARGFDIDNVMYDGIPSRYQGYVVGLQTNLAILDRVEVVRGATGLITGSGNPSAAINMVRKRPQRSFALGLTAAAGSWENYRGEIDLGGPLTADGSLRARAVGSYQDSSSFRDGEVIQRGIGYGIVEYDVSPATMLMAGVSYQDDFYNSFWGGLPLSATGQHLDLPRSTRPSSDWEGKTQKATTAFGEVRQTLGKWQLRLAAMKTWQDAIFSGSYIYRRDTDLSLTQSIYQASYDEGQSGLDGYLGGPVTVFGRAHDLVFGGSRRETRTRTQNYSPSGVIAPPYVIADMAQFDPAALPRPNFQPTTASTNIITQYGAYASARLNPADPLKIILGGRLDWYRYDNVGTVTGDYRVKANKTVYAGVLLDLDRNHTFYASYTDIFQPQSAKGFAPDTGSQAILAPIKGKNYEIGLKGEYLDGRLNATLSLFRVDQTNRAIVPVDQTGCPTFPAASCSVPAGLVRSQGFDAELQGELAPGLQVSLGYSHVRIRYLEGVSPTDKTDKFDTDYPEHIVKLSSTYALPGRLKGLKLGGSLYWQSGIYNENLGSNFKNIAFRVEQGSYVVVDLMASYAINPHLDLQLNVGNLFDRIYYRGVGYDIRWGSTDAYGEPRNVMATIRYRL
ncbi:TonB-dependent siderophore receptor [Novosphingobium sp. JCM 18896]|uniref:TonB-dependent siderophore receptor n=1 Tax=Novosphingobium sp. JCM 18896 TaxID=2989731 RepID=UPI0022218405|nr:TonB-dependent siderophore receptor [Novosphingobium sp. JCM 18896]MCW1430120.1 TonB-dependent siderophore receptor [Novosphingobium sp. JCM 18896]